MPSWADIAAAGQPKISGPPPVNEDWAPEVHEQHEMEAEDANELEPSVEELEDLRLALRKVWDLAEKLEPGTDYVLDLQGYATRKGDDHARRPLFRFVKDDALTGKPTIAAFVALLDNYEREVGKKEKLTKAEKAEERRFLETIMETPPMQYVRRYLVLKKKTSSKSFLQLLGSLWFRTYASKHGGPPDSSGFEHVFVGEERTDKHEVTGLHNWLQLYLEEKSGHLNYHGYIAPHHTKPPCDQQIISLQFTWCDAEDHSCDLKPTSSSFIGTPPELEIALYTLVALCSSSENTSHNGKFATTLNLDVLVDINCVLWNLHGAPTIRTCYPELR